METVAKVSKVDHETDAEITAKTTEMNLKIGGIKAEANKVATTINADANLYKAEREAEGQKAQKQAEAEGTQRLNEALVGEGGRNMIALEAAKKLTLTDITVPSGGYDWFNPHDMAIHLGASDEPAGTNAAGPRKGK